MNPTNYQAKQIHQPIHYRIRWKPSGHKPGSVQGKEAGIGDQLRAMVLLRDHPDPRRIDLRMSMRDPFERLWVRDFHLNAAISVIVLVDASASMGFRGEVMRIQVTQDIVGQIALAAYRAGDAFGMYVANEEVLQSYSLPPRVNRGAFVWVQKKLSKLSASGQNAEGLLSVASQLPRKQSLVFIVSDFRWPEGKLKQLLKQLNHHDVVPVLLRDPVEFLRVPKRGIAMVRDLETGQARFVWMRAAMQHKLNEARESHYQQVQQACLSTGYKPFIVEGDFESTALTRYFIERVAK